MSRNSDEICRTNYENGTSAANGAGWGLRVRMRVLRFDAFTLDQARRALFRGGAELELRSQSFDVLSYLVEHAGQLVSKQDLFETVWGGAARTDDSLVQCIKDIRQALGDSDHRIIKTVHRRGYVFVAEVSEAALTLEARPQADASILDGGSDPAATPQAKWQGPLIAAGLLMTVLAGSGWLLWKQARPEPPVSLTMMTVPSLAVLPVKPLGDETDTALAPWRTRSQRVCGVRRADSSPRSGRRAPSRMRRAIRRRSAAISPCATSCRAASAARATRCTSTSSSSRRRVPGKPGSGCSTTGWASPEPRAARLRASAERLPMSCSGPRCGARCRPNRRPATTRCSAAHS